MDQLPVCIKYKYGFCITVRYIADVFRRYIDTARIDQHAFPERCDKIRLHIGYDNAGISAVKDIHAPIV
jgi:hypothetical protein